MMEVGRITGGSFAWSRAQFGAWCVVSAPLILGLDLADTATLASVIPYVTNAEAIAVNQQWAGHPGRLVAEIEPKSAGWTHQLGALKVGNDLEGWPQNVTLDAAKKACESAASCGGITYHSPDPQPAGVLTMYLKEEGVPANSDKNWTHYSRPAAAQVWVKPQPAGKLAVYVVNPSPSGQAVTIKVDFATLGLSSAKAASVRDLWSRQDIGDTNGAQLTATVEPLDSAFMLLTPSN
jgi:hypothetical protein